MSSGSSDGRPGAFSAAAQRNMECSTPGMPSPGRKCARRCASKSSVTSSSGAAYISRTNNRKGTSSSTKSSARTRPSTRARTSSGSSSSSTKELDLAAHVERDGQLRRDPTEPLCRVVDLLDVQLRRAGDRTHIVPARGRAEHQEGQCASPEAKARSHRPPPPNELPRGRLPRSVSLYALGCRCQAVCGGVVEYRS